MSRQHNSGPNTAAIQYFDAPCSNSAGPNRAPSISTTRSRAGQVRNGRNFRGTAVSVVIVSPELVVESFMTFLLCRSYHAIATSNLLKHLPQDNCSFYFCKRYY